MFEAPIVEFETGLGIT